MILWAEQEPVTHSDSFYFWLEFYFWRRKGMQIHAAAAAAIQFTALEFALIFAAQDRVLRVALAARLAPFERMVPKLAARETRRLKKPRERKKKLFGGWCCCISIMFYYHYYYLPEAHSSSLRWRIKPLARVFSSALDSLALECQICKAMARHHWNNMCVGRHAAAAGVLTSILSGLVDLGSHENRNYHENQIQWRAHSIWLHNRNHWAIVTHLKDGKLSILEGQSGNFGARSWNSIMTTFLGPTKIN